MNRRKFLAALTAAPALPAMAKVESKSDLVPILLSDLV